MEKMDQLGKDDVPLSIPDAEPLQESESCNTSDTEIASVVKGFERLKIKLRRPLKARQHLDDGYNLPVENKGCALILSNKNNRKGSKADMQNLDKLLTLIGYNIYKYDLFYSDESDQVDLRLSKILEDFKSKISEDIKSIVVFVGSHGNFGSFETSDGKLVDFLTELVYKFSHRHCPQLEGKPKIFLTQFCQNFTVSARHLQNADDEIRNLIDKFNDFLIDKLKAQKENDPTYIEDTIICHGAIPGFEAVRYKKIGSIFIHSFCKVVMENAHKLDLCSMMVPVGVEMQRFYRHKPNGYKITPTPTLFQVNKIYFNVAPDLNMIPEKLDVYIKRKLKVGNIISGKILRHKCSDIFVFQLCQLNRVRLSSLVKDEITAVSSDCKKSIPARFIVLEEQHHFYKICEKATTDQSIHLLQEMGENRNEWKWIMSHGKVDEIQKFVRKSGELLMDVKFLSNIYSTNLTHPICIVGRPGIGKSSFLAEIGRKLTTHYPDRLVLFLQMKDFVHKVKSMGGYNFQIKIQATLQKFLRGNHLDDEEFDQIICNGSSDPIQFELLLDGVDESEDICLAHEILKFIRRAYASVRMWITSRSHFQQELERTLEVSAFKLAPFTVDDQINFLSQFWFFSKHKRSPNDKKQELKDLDQLKCFANHLLKSIKSCMRVSSRFVNDLGDIPLQCRLIGHVYEEEAYEFMQSKKMPENYSKTSSIGNLYQSYISKCLEKYKSVSGNKPEDKFVEEMHARLALEMSLRPDDCEIHEENLPIATVEMEEVFKMGIVESAHTPDSPHFIHKTFKEYFLAWLPLHLLKTSRDDPKIMEYVKNYIFKFVLKSQTCFFNFSRHDDGFTYPIISYFFDFLLAHFTIPAFIKLKHDDCSQVEVSRMLVFSVNSNYPNIFNFLNSLNQVRESGNGIFTSKLLYSATAKCNLEFFKAVLASWEQFNKIDLRRKEMLLVWATKNGNYEVLEFLINKRKLRFIVEKMETKDIRLLLHSCVTGTQDKSDLEISQRIHILQKLVSINKSLLEQIADTCTPLVSSGVHILLLKELIKSGANVLAQDNEQSNILHLNYRRQHLTPEDFHELVTSIPDEKLSELVIMKDSDDSYSNMIVMDYMMAFSKEEFLYEKAANLGETPLMKLITRIDPLPETLEKFDDAGSPFNCLDGLKYSILVQAIMNQRSGETILKIIELGADVSWRGWHGESPLHVGAYWRNIDAIRVLLDNQFNNVNDEDATGRTPLDYTVESRHEERNHKNNSFFKTGMELFERGGKLKHIFKERRHWLHHAVEYPDLEFVKLLLAIGQDVNEQDEFGNTPIHNLMQYWIENYWNCERFSEILIEFLKEDKLNISIQNNEGEAPFKLAFKIRRMDFETFKMFRNKAEAEWTRETATLGLKFLVATSTSEEEFRKGLKEIEDYQPNFSYVDDMGNSLLHLCVYNIEWRDRKHFKRKEMERAETELGTFPNFRRSWTSDINMMKYLIKNGADIYLKNRMELTFLHAIFAFLLKFPTSDFCSLTNYLNKKGCLDLFNIPGGVNKATPFQMAVGCTYMEEKILEFFHANGIDFNAVDKNEDSVLFYAAKSLFSKPQLLSTLINLGADWNHRNNQKESLLHISAISPNCPVEQPLRYVLEEVELDVNEQNVDGNTPLHCEIIEGGSLIDDKIKLLVEFGADITIENNEGLTPVQLASSLQKDYISDFLVTITKSHFDTSSLLIPSYM